MISTLLMFYFRLYGVLSAFSLIFLFGFIESNRTIVPRKRFYIYYLMAVGILLLRIFVPLEIKIVDGLISRSGFAYYYSGIDVLNLLLMIVLMLFLCELIWLTYEQMERAKSLEIKKDLKVALGIYSVAMILLIYGFLALITNTINPTAVPLMVNLPSLVILVGFSYVIFRHPYVSYLTIQRVDGVLIFSLDGVLLVDFIVSENLERTKALISSFLSAIISAMGEVIGITKLKLIAMEGYDVVLGVGKKAVVAIFVDRSISVHYTIANNIVREIDKMEVPKIVDTEFVEKVKDRIQKHLKPLIS